MGSRESVEVKYTEHASACGSVLSGDDEYYCCRVVHRGFGGWSKEVVVVKGVKGSLAWEYC